MPFETRSSAPTQMHVLEKRLKKHKEQVAELRKELGDPAEALSAFVRDRFDWQAIVPAGGSETEQETEVSEDDDSDAW